MPPSMSAESCRPPVLPHRRTGAPAADTVAGILRPLPLGRFFCAAALLQKLRLGRRRCQHGGVRNAGRPSVMQHEPQRAGTFERLESFLPSVERQDPMNETEKGRDKSARTEHERDAKRRERDKKLDKALEDS